MTLINTLSFYDTVKPQSSRVFWPTGRHRFHLGCPGEGRFLPGRTQHPAGLQLSRPGFLPHILCLLQIPTEEINNYDNSKHYVYLQAVFPNQILEKVALLSFRSKYLFIHTDKTVYTPDSKGTVYVYDVYVGWVVQ